MTATTGAVPTRLLVLGLARRDGSVDAAEVRAVATSCGLSSEQVRSCLRRLVAEGLFERSGPGRAATYSATASGRRVLDEYLERARLAYAQDHAGRGWDGRWHLVAFAVPETLRAARDALRDRLLALGGARLQDGLYVSARRWETAVGEEAGRLGIAEHITTAATDELDVAGERRPPALARRLWPVDELARRYRSFVDGHAHVPELLDTMLTRHERIDDAAFTAGALRVTVAFQAVFNDDPLLPPELLPRPWPGRAARELLLRSRRLGMRVRGGADRPALFSTYDETIDAIHS